MSMLGDYNFDYDFDHYKKENGTITYREIEYARLCHCSDQDTDHFVLDCIDQEKNWIKIFVRWPTDEEELSWKVSSTESRIFDVKIFKNDEWVSIS